MYGSGGWVRFAFVALLAAFGSFRLGRKNSRPSWRPSIGVACKLYEAGKVAEAVPVAEEYIRVAAATYGERHPHYATGLGYAHLYQLLNRPSVAIPLDNLAGLLRYTNRLAEAEPLYRRALAIDEKSFGQTITVPCTN
jgi:tetratricopeptide repeat protein